MVGEDAVRRKRGREAQTMKGKGCGNGRRTEGPSTNIIGRLSCRATLV